MYGRQRSKFASPFASCMSSKSSTTTPSYTAFRYTEIGARKQGWTRGRPSGAIEAQNAHPGGQSDRVGVCLPKVGVFTQGLFTQGRRGSFTSSFDTGILTRSSVHELRQSVDGTSENAELCSDTHTDAAPTQSWANRCWQHASRRLRSPAPRTARRPQCCGTRTTWRTSAWIL